MTVHRLGYGAMRIVGEGVIGEPEDPQGARSVLRRAAELGVNFIDTADSYGPEVSERLIHEALHPYADGLVIATKGGFERPGPGQWEPNGRPEHLREACEASLKRLGLDTIDLYQLHVPDSKVPYEESIGALRDLQQEGKVRHVGVSNVDEEQLARARAIVDVVSVQNRYSMSDRDTEPVLRVCERDELGFIPWFPLARGKLAEPGGPVDRVAEEHGASPSQVALAWLLRRSPVTMPIPGTSKVEHLEENLKSSEVNLTDEDMAALDA
ncbi:MAG: aldo/keto reductase [Thermoleophilaceae bacterium]|nr:aldo/keto reductase [Thermoleophilaceae bacterium]